ncbi:MAG: type 4a pilus biogenesis protein PilO [Actinomycetota bacterium]|nr:type 4a pilus biogenesis protein PilO [Actinomycetota bacterium]
MRRNMIVAVVASIVVVLLFWIALISPKMKQVKEVNAKIAAAEDDEQQLRLTLRQLQQAKENAAATQAKLAQFQMLLPPTPDLPTFIREVQAAANADGIDLQSIAPTPPSTLSGAITGSAIQSISVTLQVQGGFFRMESFLARLEDLQRVVEVKNLSMSPLLDKLTGTTTLQSTVTMTMYVVPPGATAAEIKRTPATTGGAAASPAPSPSGSPR